MVEEKSTDEVERARRLREVVLTIRDAWAAVPTPPGMDEFDAQMREEYGDRYETPDRSLGEGKPGERVYFAHKRRRWWLMRARWEEQGLWLERFLGINESVEVLGSEPTLLELFIGEPGGGPDFDVVKIGENEAQRIINALADLQPHRNVPLSDEDLARAKRHLNDE